MKRAFELAALMRVPEPSFMSAIRLRARRRALWIRAQGAAAVEHAYGGVVIADAEVDRILSDAVLAAEAEAEFYGNDPAGRRLTEAIQQADIELRRDDAWLRLSQAFSLSSAELDFLALVAAVEIDPGLRRAYGYLNDDATACYPTPWLAGNLFEWRTGVRFGPDAALVRWRLARPVDSGANPWGVQEPWTADPDIVTWISDGVPIGPTLTGALALPDRNSLPATCLYPSQLGAMRDFVQAMQHGLASRPGAASSCDVVIHLRGAAGSGKRTLIAQLCDALGRQVMFANADLLLGIEVPLPTSVDNAIGATRAARLSDAVLCWVHAEAINPKLWTYWTNECSGYLTFFSSTGLMNPSPRLKNAWRSYVVPPLDRAPRLAVWAAHADGPIPEVIANRRLLPAEIAQAARVAPAGPEAIVDACRQPLDDEAGELLALLPCPYVWDDLVLDPGVRRHLAEVEAQASMRWQVYEEWGFGKLCPLAKGVTAMLTGPSGTGKTMAAQVLAASLGMDLYRIDLAGVVNKYIGETEKRLKRVFDVCERGNCLLFFDEADALFGLRTQVRDAHDRYANIEIDYLLQRMEQFDGLAILATNRKSDIDPAFLRRIRFVIDFLPPGKTERLALWRLSLPTASPQGEPLLDQIDWDFLAGRLVLTGADIKSAALGAAFLARMANTRIGMQQVLYAAHREMAKRGIVARTGEWQG